MGGGGRFGGRDRRSSRGQSMADPDATQQPRQDNDDDHGKWGLLGLLGLGGLLGLKRRDRDDHRHTTTGTNRP